MRVSLFVTCVVDTLFPETGRATVTVLERAGCEVRFPRSQTCCGQPHLNSGYPEHARALAERWQEVFADSEAIVSPSASCVGTLRDLLGPGPPLYELTEFLTKELGVLELGAWYPRRVAYHATCHSQRALGLGVGPLSLLHAVRGIELVEIENADECCGFGGTFAVKNPDVSTAIGADKVGKAIAAGAEVITAVDDSCLMHLWGLLRRRASTVETRHIAQILAARPGEDGR